MRGALVHVAALALLLLAAAGVRAADEAETTALYGILELPPAYFGDPSSESEINRLQPGTVLLHNGQRTLSVPVRKDGAFTIYGLPYGTYLLQADYHDFVFPTVRVEVQYKDRSASADESTKKVRVPVIRAIANDYPVKPLRGSGADEQSPVVIPAIGAHSYYIPRGEFRIMDLLKSPMILMMLLSFGLMGMMKLFPEEEIKESQRMSREWQKKMLKRASGAAEGSGGAAVADRKR